MFKKAKKLVSLGLMIPMLLGSFGITHVHVHAHEPEVKLARNFVDANTEVKSPFVEDFDYNPVFDETKGTLINNTEALNMPKGDYIPSTGGTGPGGSGTMDSPGVMMEIITVPNPNRQYDNAATLLQDKYLNTYIGEPTSSKVSNSAFVKILSGKALQASNYFQSGGQRIGKFSNVYSVKPGTSADITRYMLDGLVKAFTTKTNDKDWAITWEEYEQVRSENSGNTAYLAFRDIWGKSENAAKEMMEYMENAVGVMESYGIKGSERIAYLDILSMINELSGRAYDPQIKHYLQHYNSVINKVNPDKFVVIQVTALGGAKVGGGSQNWYTAHGFYAEMFKRPVNTLYTSNNKGFNYFSNEAEFEKLEATNMHGLMKGAEGNSSYRDNTTIWSSYGLQTSRPFYVPSSDFDFRYVALPTDISGNATGNAGYTFLTMAHDTDHLEVQEPGSLAFTIELHANPKGAPVPDSGTDTADIKMEIKWKDAESSIGEIKRLKEECADTKITLDVELMSKVVGGSANNGTIMDTVAPWSEYASSSGFKGVEVTDSVAQQMATGVKIDIKDDYSMISPVGAKVQYITKGVITVDYCAEDREDSLTTGDPLGKEVTDDTAWDVVSWVPQPKSYKYYANAREPYVEIKHNDPEDEQYEAMAGVPTTEDLYVGFGAKEFDVQFETEARTQDDAMRRVAIECNAQSIGEGKPCPSAGKVCKGCPKEDGTIEFHPADPACGGGTCKPHPLYNKHHPGPYSAVYETVYEIDEFAYLDTTDAIGVVLSRAEYRGNPELLDDPDRTITVDLGTAHMISQDKYSDGNGRLGFDFDFEDNVGWGNEVMTYDFGIGLTKELNEKANGKFNDHKGFSDKVTVFSDSIILDTTVGPQVMQHYEYESQPFEDKGGEEYEDDALDFGHGGGTVSYGITTKTAKFDKLPTGDEMWGTYAGQYVPEDIIASGYNGDFANPESKWKHTGKLVGETPLRTEYWFEADSAHPNWDNRIGTEHREPVFGFENDMLLMKDFNIIDSTDESGFWSAGDFIEPVYNGEWDTGESWVAYSEFMMQGMTGGPLLVPEENIEAKYSPAHETINDIVIHNPVSVEDVTIISNPEKWDMRTEESLKDGGDPIDPNIEFCPGDGLCEFSHLDCDAEFRPHTDSCYDVRPNGVKVLICTEPHHYELGKPFDPMDPKYHKPFPHGDCYSACGDDAKHQGTPQIVVDGEPAKKGDIFINLDKPFKLYYPDQGDFAQQPNLHGIAETTAIRGMGYEDNMDTTPWLRDKFVTFPVNVIDADNNAWRAGEPIRLTDLPHNGNVYDFHAVLGNSEYANATVTYLSIGNNAKEVSYYDESDGVTNRQRNSSKYEARHTATKLQPIDVVGFIGNLALNDVGDFRYATLFKQEDGTGEWLVPNLVLAVDERKPKYVLQDNINILQDIASQFTNYHSNYGITESASGGKAHPYVSLPLTPKDNPIEVLRDEPLRPGYQLYMDVETIGNYYGEGWTRAEGSDVDVPRDYDMNYKLQITPSYWELDLDTGEYLPVDVYMGTNGDYQLLVPFDEEAPTAQWYYYLDWLNESVRRNFTPKEKDSTYAVQSQYSNMIAQGVRVPQSQKDPIGTPKRIFLNDINRTFIGSSETYGNDMNPGNVFYDLYFNRQSQRWHFTLGLPSSAKFVYEGEKPTIENFKKITDNNSVIVNAIDIKAKGEVWTLEYDGENVNYSDKGGPGEPEGETTVVPPTGYPELPGPGGGGGIQITPGGTVYPPPPKDPGEIEDPVIVIIDPEFTSEDDLMTEGSH